MASNLPAWHSAAPYQTRQSPPRCPAHPGTSQTAPANMYQTCRQYTCDQCSIGSHVLHRLPNTKACHLLHNKFNLPAFQDPSQQQFSADAEQVGCGCSLQHPMSTPASAAIPCVGAGRPCQHDTPPHQCHSCPAHCPASRRWPCIVTATHTGRTVLAQLSSACKAVCMWSAVAGGCPHGRRLHLHLQMERGCAV